uniref:Putative salivary kunitz domain protein n=1 Tax=Ixodes ricinus TaxID=34613 RepID=A0A0K8RJB3_IXORI
MNSTLRFIFVVSLVIVAFIVEDTASKKREREKMPPRCLEKPDVSSCRGYFDFYFYNKTIRRCEKSPIRGCPRDGNGFLDHEDCLTTCQDKRRRFRPKLNKKF